MKYPIYYTGFADEAGQNLETQIRATKELGWSNIEMRGVEVAGYPAGNLHDIPDEAFEVLVNQLNAAGVRVNSLGSAIGNWSRDIRKPFDKCLAETRRAAPRAKRLGAEFIRVMSYPAGDPSDLLEEERFHRLREVVRIFADTGVTVVHENCGNYGSLGWTYCLKLLENVPGLKLVFDTANTVGELDYSRPAPHPKQSSLDFFRHVKEHVVYVHVKDRIHNPRIPGEAHKHVFPGEGEGQVREVLKELLAGGYSGGISIEPHMGEGLKLVSNEPHPGAGLNDPSLSPEENKYRIYTEYGRQLVKLIDEI